MELLAKEESIAAEGYSDEGVLETFNCTSVDDSLSVPAPRSDPGNSGVLLNQYEYKYLTPSRQAPSMRTAWQARL